MDILATPVAGIKKDSASVWKASFVACGLIGFVACQWHELYILATVVIVLWAKASTRVEAYCYVLIYTICSTWVVVPAIIDYLSWGSGQAFILWAAAMPVIILPWYGLYRSDNKCLELRLLSLLVLTWIPPIGLVQFASPFVGTSLLMPGFGWVSVAVGVVLVSLLIRLSTTYGWQLPALTLAVVIGLSSYISQPQRIPGWIAVNTAVEVGGLNHTISGSLKALREVREVSERDRPAVAVLGESTGGYSVSAAEMILGRVTESTVIIAGGRIDTQQAVFKWTSNSSEIVYRQRVRPVLLGHMDGEREGNRTTIIDGIKVAPLICYEGAVPYPLASAMGQKPKAIVVMGNFNWSRNARYFERVLRSHVSAWGRIFSVPTIVAVNRRLANV